MAPQIRPATPDDIEALAAIDRIVFEARWEAEDFNNFLGRSRGLAFVVDRDECVIAYVLCETFTARLQLVRIAVHPRYWQKNVGRSLVKTLKTGLRRGGREKILAEVDERNVPAQLFLKAVGFRAVAAIKGFFGDTGAIQFEHRLMPRDTQLDFFCWRRSRQL